MTSKPNADPMPPDGCWNLPHEVLAVEGRDAADFLQRQCMNDVAALDADGRWQWNGLLSPKGRVLALFALLRCAPDAYWLLLGDGDATGWAAELQRYVFRAKVKLRGQAAGVLGFAGAIEGLSFGAPSQAVAEAEGYWLDHGSPGRPRALWVGNSPTPPAFAATVPLRDDPAAWTLENIRHGLPRLPPARRDHHTPQMLGLDRLAAFSVKKGCYPGQEIVARTHFLGKAKRQLARLVAIRALHDDEPVSGGGHEARVFDHASHEGHHEGMAVLPIEAAADTWRLGDGSVVELAPVITGLAR